MSSTDLVRAEWRKARTMRLNWILLAIGVAYAAVQALMLVLIASGMLPGVPADSGMLLEPAYVDTILGQASSAATFALIVGIIAITGEFRHMTITSTFLATPRRGRVLVAKGIVMACMGVVAALASVVVVVLVTAVALTPFAHAPITAASVLGVVVGAALGMALYAIVGLGFGSIVTNQVAAVVTALLWLLLIEPLAGLAFPVASRWLPGGALNSALGVSMRADMSGGMASAHLLPQWAGVLVLLGYAVVLAAVGTRTSIRRDIT